MTSTIELKMMKIKVRDDGWINLPTTVRKRLGLFAGNDIRVEMSGDDLLLLRAGAKLELQDLDEAPKPARRKPGRPKKR